MNLFTVLASAPLSTFPEEQASALLAWLLQPGMEHGLGYAFLAQLVQEIAEQSPVSQLSDPPRDLLKDLAGKLKTRLRSDDPDRIEVRTYLEYNASRIGTFVDIVLTVGNDWVVAIENKIRAGAVSTGQLQREFDGLVADKNVMETGSSSRRLMMIYLVPVGCDSAHAEFARLASSDHTKIFMTWQADPVEPGPSVAGVIKSLLAGEADGDVAPIHEYVRHTLKSLLNFVANGFAGYPFTDGRTPSSGLNPLTECRLRFLDLTAKPAGDGFVGIQGGIVGLLGDLNSGKIRTHQYQYTTQSAINGRPGWIPIRTFQLIAEIETGSCDLSWLDGPLRLPADTIVYLAKQCPTGFYVGIRGGVGELKRLVGERRAEGSLVWRSTDVWSIRQDTSMLSRTAWWMRADEFLKATE